MARKLYELVGVEPDRPFSPYCWRTRMALAHKQLPVDSVPWRFTDTEALAFSGQGKVPVLVDGAKTVFDSWTIAGYLEDTYSDKPSLFDGLTGKAMAAFFGNWVDSVVHGALARIILLDIYEHIGDKDKAYFRKSREERFGTTLEAVVADPEAKLAAFRQALHPVRMTVRQQPFLGGSGPRYADYILFGAFQWARAISPRHLLAADDPIAAWRARLLDLHGGLAGKAKGFPV
ncbi:MAG: glutathione S-transferase family protein [Proteobacteria bacterium]|nr:glutathione S-transferase family protein [Pseudomonadota bacterium]